jgi:maltose alpha-D-glucosyltransferase/alpha-amylase
LLLNADYATGDPEVYVLPVAHAGATMIEGILTNNPSAAIARVGDANGAEGLLYDAMSGKAFAQALLDGLAESTTFHGTEGRLVARATSAFAALRGGDSSAIQPTVSKAEHSNTAVIFGDRLLFKLFRRPEAGINPDVEIGGYLTDRKFPNVPRLGGTLEYRGPDGVRSLGILTQFIPGATDGWDYTLDALGRYFDRVLLYVAENQTSILPEGSLLTLSDAEPNDDVIKAVGTYLESARLLGVRTAELHLALGANEDPDFAAEPFSPHYQRSLYQSMRNLVVENFELLKRQRNDLPVQLQQDAQAILSAQNSILARYQRLYAARLDAMRIRVHGDYHLGQVLSTGTDFVILDFEGEPARALSARRLKRSPISDLAGMLRSFHYAVHTALRTQAQRGLLTPENQKGVVEWAIYWRRWISATYLRAYLRTMGDSRLLPRNRGELEILLDAYLIDKAVYEMGYELNNRPEWLAIPFSGILQHLRSSGT